MTIALANCLYIAGSNTPGYLPDGDPVYCETFDEAVEIVRMEIAFDTCYAEDHGLDAQDRELCAAMEVVDSWSIADLNSAGELSVIAAGVCYWLQYRMEADTPEPAEATEPTRPSRKLAVKCSTLLREFDRSVEAGSNDPMTDHYGAAEFVVQWAQAALDRQLRALGIGHDAARDAATQYRLACAWARRLAKPHQYGPARLAWRAAHAQQRELAQRHAWRMPAPDELTDLPF